VHIVGFMIRIHHDARSPERQILYLNLIFDGPFIAHKYFMGIRGYINPNIMSGTAGYKLN
jgi:hypothetical protein